MFSLSLQGFSQKSDITVHIGIHIHTYLSTSMFIRTVYIVSISGFVLYHHQFSGSCVRRAGDQHGSRG